MTAWQQQSLVVAHSAEWVWWVTSNHHCGSTTEWEMGKGSQGFQAGVINNEI